MILRDVRDYAHRARVQRHLEASASTAPDPDFVACLRDTIMDLDHRSPSSSRAPVSVDVEGAKVEVADLGHLTPTEAREAGAELLHIVAQESTLGRPRS